MQGFLFFWKSSKIIHFCNFLKKFFEIFKHFLRSLDPLRGRPPKIPPPEPKSWRRRCVWCYFSLRRQFLMKYLRIFANLFPFPRKFCSFSQNFSKFFTKNLSEILAKQELHLFPQMIEEVSEPTQKSREVIIAVWEKSMEITNCLIVFLFRERFLISQTNLTMNVLNFHWVFSIKLQEIKKPSAKFCDLVLEILKRWHSCENPWMEIWESLRKIDFKIIFGRFYK